MSIPMPQQSAMDSAIRYLVITCNPKCNRVGWLMMVFVLIFIRNQYYADPFVLGLAGAATQGVP